MVTVVEALQAAVQHHRSGEFEQAGSIYEQILWADPNHADALQLVGVMSQQLGRPHDAIQFIERAIAVRPDVPEFHNNLAAAWMDAANPAEAARCCRKAIQLRPRYVEAHCNLGNALQALGDLADAEFECRRAVELAPTHANAWFNLGNVQRDREECADAVDSYRHTTRIDPSHYRAYNNLGQLLTSMGKPREAARACRRALRIRPQDPSILKNLAAAECRAGKLDTAIGHYQSALAASPDDVHLMNTLGLLLYRARRFQEAVGYLEQAIQLQPHLYEAHNNLGMVRAAQGKHFDAVACYQESLRLHPDSVETLCNLGSALRAFGNFEQARSTLKRATELQPDSVEAHNNLGTVLQSLGLLEEALICYRKSIELRPDYADGLCNLAGLYSLLGDPDEAERLFRSALALEPDSVDVLNNLGNLLRDKGQLHEAAVLLRRAVDQRETDSELHNNLANVLKDGGRIDDAIMAFDRALELEPTLATAVSNQLTCRQYIPGITLDTLANEHAKYGNVMAFPLQSLRKALTNSRDPNRRLRVGFVSSDFGCHPVGHLLVRGFEALNADQFITVCYSNRRLSDELTTRIRTAAATWRDVDAMSDENLAAQIRADGIDILVDLAGHTAGNRLLVFARKPAPVQVTWLGYVGTTGMTAMDYLLTDRLQVPASAERFYVEQIVRLPESHIVFEPPPDSPEVGPLPLLQRGCATFASFNNPAKISESVVRLWAEVLQRSEGSQLLLKYRGFDDRFNLDRYSKLFHDAGIEQQRLELQGRSPMREMLDEYNRVDLTLDPFPFTGGMTTLLSLWMGVPVITVAGETIASRQSMSFLTQVGLTELIAESPQDYVDRATILVRDHERLQDIRASLRERLLGSSLCNSDQFARSLESAFRKMWRKWCRS